MIQINLYQTIYKNTLVLTPSNRRNRTVLNNRSKKVPLCMGTLGLRIWFTTCNSLDSSQQWVISKTENASDSVHICRRDPLPFDVYEVYLPQLPQTIKPNKEARYLISISYTQSPMSQYWLMNSTTHQLSNVQYPKGCITTRHLNDPAIALILECIGNDYESPNPKLSKHQSFYIMPVLDKNNQQLCMAWHGLLQIAEKN